MLKEGFDKYILFGAPRENRLMPPHITLQLCYTTNAKPGYYKAITEGDVTTYKYLDGMPKNISVAVSVDSIEPYEKIDVLTNEMYIDSIKDFGGLPNPQDNSYLRYFIYRMFKDLIYPQEPPLRINGDYSDYVKYEGKYLDYEARFVSVQENRELLLKVAEKFANKRASYIKSSNVQILEAFGVAINQQNRELKRNLNTLTSTVESLIPMRLLDESQRRTEVRRLLSNSDEAIKESLNNIKDFDSIRKALSTDSNLNIVGQEILKAIPTIDERVLIAIKNREQDLTTILFSNWIKAIKPIIDKPAEPGQTISALLDKDIENPIQVIKGFPNIEVTVNLDLGILNDLLDYMTNMRGDTQVGIIHLSINNFKTGAGLLFEHLGIKLEEVLITTNSRRFQEGIPELDNRTFFLEEIDVDKRLYTRYYNGKCRLSMNLNALVFSKYY